MILYPNMLLQSVTEITEQLLRKNNINALILDVDNTLINIEQKLTQEVKDWAKRMKEK